MRLEDVAGQLPAWFADAACLGMDSEVFFPEGAGASTAAAKQVCGTCPCIKACGAYAAAEGFTAGVFGGQNLAAKSNRRGGRRAAA